MTFTKPPEEWLKVVPLLTVKEVEEIYWQVRSSRAESQNSVIEPEIKQRICWNVLESGIFSGMAEPLNMDKWYRYLKLKLKYRKFMNLLTDKNRIFTRSPLTYPIRSVDVHLSRIEDHQIVTDRAFICLAQDLRSKKTNLLDFHISQEYNVNLESDDYVAGRFILVREKIRFSELMTLYLAEEPAKVIEDRSNVLEDLYLESRQKRGTVMEEDNPLCTLEGKKLVEVCSAVLSSSFFAGRIKYSPTGETAAKMKCTKLEITFKHHEVPRSTYEDRIIPCPARSAKDGHPISYYISHGDKPNNIFLFIRNPSDELIYLLNLSTNIKNYRHRKRKDEPTFTREYKPT